VATAEQWQRKRVAAVFNAAGSTNRTVPEIKRWDLKVEARRTASSCQCICCLWGLGYTRAVTAENGIYAQGNKCGWEKEGDTDLAEITYEAGKAHFCFTADWTSTDENIVAALSFSSSTLDGTGSCSRGLSASLQHLCARIVIPLTFRCCLGTSLSTFPVFPPFTPMRASCNSFHNTGIGWVLFKTW